MVSFSNRTLLVYMAIGEVSFYLLEILPSIICKSGQETFAAKGQKALSADLASRRETFSLPQRAHRGFQTGLFPPLFSVRPSALIKELSHMAFSPVAVPLYFVQK